MKASSSSGPRLEIHRGPWVEDRDEIGALEIQVVTPMKGLFQEADRLWKELAKYLSGNGIPEAGPSYLRFRVINMEADMAVSVGFPVSGRPGGNGRVVPAVLPRGRYACLRYVGHGLVANKTLLGWVSDQGLAMDRWDDPQGDAFGCRRETFLTDRRLQPLKKKWTIELSIRLAGE